MPATNMKLDEKTSVWRTTQDVKTATITALWGTSVGVSCVAIPFCNFSSTATMRVVFYSTQAVGSVIYDSGDVLCSVAGTHLVRGMTPAQSASAYAQGGGNVATFYTTVRNVQRIDIIIKDPNNLQGYLEVARLVVGDYFSPQRNAEYGVGLCMEDTTKNYRTDAGSLKSDVGTRNKKLSLDLNYMSEADRDAVWRLVKYCGINTSVFLSVLPDSTDKAMESAYTIYGKFTDMSTIAASSYKVFSMPLEIEGV